MEKGNLEFHSLKLQIYQVSLVYGEASRDPDSQLEPEDANGWFSSSAEVGRSSGFTLRNLIIKSLASSDNVSGMSGSSPLSILNRA